VADSFIVASIAWLAGSLLFLALPRRLVPVTFIAFVSCTIQLLGEKYISTKRILRYRLAFILSGQLCALLVAPVVGGRFLSKVDELGSFDVNHFGVVTLTLIGGIVGGVLRMLFRNRNNSLV